MKASGPAPAQRGPRAAAESRYSRAKPQAKAKGATAMKPITDKAEVSIDFPDKVYMGSFGKTSGFEVKADPDEVMLKLLRTGEQRREFSLHLHYYLLADIIVEGRHGFERRRRLADDVGEQVVVQM